MKILHKMDMASYDADPAHVQLDTLQLLLDDDLLDVTIDFLHLWVRAFGDVSRDKSKPELIAELRRLL